jgi:hypothetical protein
VWELQWCWCGQCVEISVYNVRHVWEERARVGFPLVPLFTSRSGYSGLWELSSAWHREYTFDPLFFSCVFTRAFTWSSHSTFSLPETLTNQSPFLFTGMSSLLSFLQVQPLVFSHSLGQLASWLLCVLSESDHFHHHLIGLTPQRTQIKGIKGNKVTKHSSYSPYSFLKNARTPTR